MSNTIFHFKQFSIRQERCAMKVGTDGVLLGAWAALPGEGRVLDVGTGTGLLALMAAQRTHCLVDAIELMPEAAAQAADNVAASPWAARIQVQCVDARHYAPSQSYDAVVCNPPFYDGALLPPDDARLAARHAGSLSPEALAHLAARWLRPAGCLHVVLPLDVAPRMENACAGGLLFPVRRTVVQTHTHKAPRRVLLTFSRESLPLTADTLLLTDAAGLRTEAFAELTRDFYL